MLYNTCKQFRNLSATRIIVCLNCYFSNKTEETNMTKIKKKTLASVLAIMLIINAMCVSVGAMSETSMSPVYDAMFTVSKKDYVEIPYANDLYDKVSIDKTIEVYHSDSPTYISFYDSDEFEYALSTGKIEYVTSIGAEKVEIKKGAHNIYGQSFNGLRIYWGDENFTDEGYYLFKIESGTLVSADGEYCNFLTFLADV